MKNRKNKFFKILSIFILLSFIFTNNFLANAIYQNYNLPKLENNFESFVKGGSMTAEYVYIEEVEFDESEMSLKCATVPKPLGEILQDTMQAQGSFYNSNEQRVEFNINLGERIVVPLTKGEDLKLRIHNHPFGTCFVEDLENEDKYNTENDGEISLKFAKINFVKVESDSSGEFELHKYVYDEKGNLNYLGNLEYETEIIETKTTDENFEIFFRDLEDGDYMIKNKRNGETKDFTMDLRNRDRNNPEPYKILTFEEKMANKAEINFPEKIKLPDYMGKGIFNYQLSDVGIMEINEEKILTSSVKRVLIKEKVKELILKNNPNLILEDIDINAITGNVRLIFPDNSIKVLEESEVFEFGNFINFKTDLPEKIENNHAILELNYEKINTEEEFPIFWFSEEDTCNSIIQRDTGNNFLIKNNIIPLAYHKDFGKFVFNPGFINFQNGNIEIYDKDFFMMETEEYKSFIEEYGMMKSPEEINGKYICVGDFDSLGFFSTFSRSKNRINLDGSISNEKTENIEKQEEKIPEKTTETPKNTNSEIITISEKTKNIYTSEKSIGLPTNKSALKIENDKRVKLKDSNEEFERIEKKKPEKNIKNKDLNIENDSRVWLKYPENKSEEKTNISLKKETKSKNNSSERKSLFSEQKKAEVLKEIEKKKKK